MIRLFGLLSFLLALFLLPMNFRLLTDALEVGGTAAGAWIFFSIMLVLTLSSGWMGVRFLRRA